MLLGPIRDSLGDILHWWDLIEVSRLEFMNIKIALSILLFYFSFHALADENSQDNYQVLTLSLNDKTLVLIRCNAATGEGWYRIGSKWVKGVEENPIAPSRYLCRAQTFGQNGWILVRLDVNNGQIWTLQNEVWRTVLK